MMKTNNLNRLREVYAPHGGKDMGANAVLNLCDELEYLRKIAAHVPQPSKMTKTHYNERNKIVAKEITERVAKQVLELEGRYFDERACFAIKASIFPEVLDVLKNGVDC